MRPTELRRAWLGVHHLGRAWLAAVIGSWVALWLFASVSIPLKYPYEAAGQVLDSGVFVGLLVPLAVMNVALDEGPPDLVRLAARSLLALRSAMAVAYLVTAALVAATTAAAARLPIVLVLCDSLLLGALSVAGVATLGVRLGWLPAAIVAFVLSAPGLVPFDYNLVYQRDVDPTLVLLVGLVGVGGAALFAFRGSVGGRSRDVD